MSTPDIYIYGASGHGHAVADVARAIGYRNIVFLDDSSGTKFSADLPQADIFVAIGQNDIRQKLCNRVTEAGFNLVSLIHPTAVISPSATIGAGTVAMPMVVVNANAQVSVGCILNTCSIVEHDCTVGEYAHISPNAALAGNVHLAERVNFGIGSCAIQGVHVGTDSVIGAGSVVVRDIPPNVVAFGNPAKVWRSLD